MTVLILVVVGYLMTGWFILQEAKQTGEAKSNKFMIPAVVIAILIDEAICLVKGEGEE